MRALFYLFYLNKKLNAYVAVNVSVTSIEIQKLRKTIQTLENEKGSMQNNIQELLEEIERHNRKNIQLECAY